jgi:hypothetical protein
MKMPPAFSFCMPVESLDSWYVFLPAVETSGIRIFFRDIAAMWLRKMNSRQFSLIKARKEPPLRQGNGRSPAREHFFRIHHGKEK